MATNLDRPTDEFLDCASQVWPGDPRPDFDHSFDDSEPSRWGRLTLTGAGPEVAVAAFAEHQQEHLGQVRLGRDESPCEQCDLDLVLSKPLMGFELHH